MLPNIFEQKGKVVKVVTVGTRKKKIYRKAGWSPKVNVVRYRDDFVVTAATKRILEVLVKPAVNEFLDFDVCTRLNVEGVNTMPLPSAFIDYRSALGLYPRHKYKKYL
jgi:hypothetical protein